MSHSVVTINHDVSELHYRSITIVLLLTTIFLVITGIGTAYYYEGTHAQEVVLKENASGQIASLQEVREYEHQMLNSKKELDSAKGIYQIPITDAMAKVVKRYQVLQK